MNEIVKENSIQIFESEEFGKIRTMKINSEPWFVGKDVALALGYSDTKSALADHVDVEDKRIVQKGQIATLEIPNRGLTIINESGLYSLIFSSKLPTAQEFKHWIFDEILPSIHQKSEENSVNNVMTVGPTVQDGNIEIFTNSQFGKIRTIKENDNILFCASDVAKALGYKDTINAIKQHCKGVVKRHIFTTGGNQEVNFIPESDLYRLVIRSKLPDAEKFTDWVTSEVLPSIRKHGAYMTTETLQAAILNPDYLLQIVTALKEETDKRKALEIVVEEQKLKVEFADKVSGTKNLINMNRMAKLLHDQNIEIGRNRLLEFLREEKILMSDNVPYQQYIEQGYFEVRESVKDMGKWQKTIQTTLVTGKGQQFVCKKVQKSYGNGVRE